MICLQFYLNLCSTKILQLTILYLYPRLDTAFNSKNLNLLIFIANVYSKIIY